MPVLESSSMPVLESSSIALGILAKVANIVPTVKKAVLIVIEFNYNKSSQFSEVINSVLIDQKKK